MNIDVSLKLLDDEDIDEAEVIAQVNHVLAEYVCKGLLDVHGSKCSHAECTEARVEFSSQHPSVEISVQASCCCTTFTLGLSSRTCKKIKGPDGKISFVCTMEEDACDSSQYEANSPSVIDDNTLCACAPPPSAPTRQNAHGSPKSPLAWTLYASSLSMTVAVAAEAVDFPFTIVHESSRQRGGGSFRNVEILREWDLK
jgi:hypothetical protein